MERHDVAFAEDRFEWHSTIAIELDGVQHLANAEGYRRAAPGLLQENGYHVLRFLCEDVGKRLDEVLDPIVRALLHRCTRRITEKGRS